MNKLQSCIMVGLLSASVFGTAWAATIIERQEMGKTQKVTLEGENVRIDSSNPNFYILMDLKKGNAYMVNGKEKRIVKLKIVGKPPTLPSQSPQYQQPKRRSEPVKAKLVKIGNGSSIAGYPTVNYEMKANNQVCSEESFSKQAALVPYVKDFLNAISQLSSSRQIKGMPLPPCVQANNDLEAEYLKLGMSMKTVVKGKNGNTVLYKITSIKTDVGVPSRLFRLPSYKIISEQEMIKENMAKRNQWRREEQRR